MIQKVLLPKLGQTVEQAVIETWHKSEGDAVKKGDVLCEITTDKATLEVESYFKGTLLKIIGQSGQELPVNSVIAFIGDESDEVTDEMIQEAQAGPAPAEADGQETPKAEAAPAPKSEPKPAPKPAAPPPAPAPAPAPVVQAVQPTGRIVASPRARRAAKDKHVPLAVLTGTGPDGRIVEADVLAYAEKIDAAGATPVARKLAAEKNIDIVALAQSLGRKVTKDDLAGAQVAAAAPGAAAAVQPWRAPRLKEERVKLTPMRRIVAERMSQSKADIPCYYLHMDVDFTDLMAARSKLNARLGYKVSINDYIILACGRCLAEFPEVNSKWDGDGIIRRGEANVSLAIALDEGLIVPVVRDVEKKSLTDVAADTRDLVERARSKRLLPDEYEGGCMTVSNLGMFGIKHFIPVVNPGESCILGLGIIEQRPVVRQGGIFFRQVMTAALACDHRLIDGAVGARFFERLKEMLEHPAQLEM